jgi:hypothetical protein
MTSVLKGSERIPDDAKMEYTRAIADWVKSIPEAEAQSPSVYVSGVGYSPSQILREIKEETEFGLEFLAGLHAVSRRMGAAKKGGSIVALIQGQAANLKP